MPWCSGRTSSACVLTTRRVVQPSASRVQQHTYQHARTTHAPSTDHLTPRTCQEIRSLLSMGYCERSRSSRMCDQPTPAMPEHASHPVAWSAVIAPCSRPCLHICPPKSRRDRALLLRPSRVRRRSVTGRDARRRRSVASVPSTASPGESCSAPSELLAATMAATGARSRWRTGVRRKPQRRRWQCRRVHERYFAQRATCMWSEESV